MAAMVSFIRVSRLGQDVCRPEFFKIVEAADFRTEDMDDDVACINQYPVTLGNAFDTDVFLAVFFQFFNNLISDGVDVAAGTAGGHDHGISHS